MKTILFSLLFAFYFALINASGTSYYATFYGGSEDGDTELNPSCGGKRPDTDYYAAVSTGYDHDLCGSYAVVMPVTDDPDYNGKMIKVKIIDSCHECTESHVDLSRDAFSYIRNKKVGEVKIIWVAATSEGKITRDIIYPSSATEEFAKKVYGLSKSQFVSMYKKQALKMIKNHQTSGKFDKYDVPTTTTTTTTVAPTTTAAASATAAAPAVTNAPTVNGIGNITIVTGQTNDNSVPDAAPIVGKTKTVDPNKTDYTEEDIKTIEENFEDKETEEGSFAVGYIAAGLSVSSAAGIGLLYLKKQSPNKYEEIKSKFPEAFDNVKRSVSRSATSIKRGLTRSVSKGSKAKVSRHADHSNENYREMPDHMFSNDGLPRITLYDKPMEDFPETTIKM